MQFISVQGTVLFGRDHDQIGVLIEPRPGQEIDVNDEKQLAEMRNKLWCVKTFPITSVQRV